MLARLTAVLGPAARDVPDVPDADRIELPDLGAGFNDEMVWRHHVAKLAWQSLGLEPHDGGDE